MQPTLDAVRALAGKDFAMLTAEEKETWDFYYSQGRKYGVTVTRVTEAPDSELVSATSREQYDQLVSRYPSKIKVVIDTDAQIVTGVDSPAFQKVLSELLREVSKRADDMEQRIKLDPSVCIGYDRDSWILGRIIEAAGLSTLDI